MCRLTDTSAEHIYVYRLEKLILLAQASHDSKYLPKMDRHRGVVDPAFYIPLNSLYFVHPFLRLMQCFPTSLCETADEYFPTTTIHGRPAKVLHFQIALTRYAEWGTSPILASVDDPPKVFRAVSTRCGIVCG